MHLALYRSTVAAWLRRYRDGRLEALLAYKEAGAPAGQKPLPPAMFTQLKTRLATPTGFAPVTLTSSAGSTRSLC
jgi:hypothetical protein